MAEHAAPATKLETEVLALCREIVHPTIELETDLLAEGLLDSFHTLKLVTELEDKYGVEIDLATLGEEDVQSPRAMAVFLQKKQA